MTARLSAVTVALVLAFAVAVPAPAQTPSTPQPDAYRDQPALAYVSKGRVFVLDGKGSPPLRVRGTTGACCVAFSPDGYYVAFQQRGDLWVVEHDGSELHRVARSVGRWAWAPDGQALAVIPKPGRGGSGGTGITIYGAEDSRIRDTQLPDYRVLDLAWSGLGRRLAVSAVPAGKPAARAEVFMLEVPGPYGEDCPALCPEAPVHVPVDHPDSSSGPLFAGWSPSVDSIAVWTAPDNGATLGLVSPRGGGITPIAQTVVRRAWVQWSRGGDRLLVVEGRGGEAGAPRALLLCTVTSSCSPIAGGSEPVVDPAWSRAGRIAYVRAERRELWVANREGADAYRITPAGEGVSAPLWLPDSRHLVFVRDGTVWLLDVTAGDAVPVAGGLGPGAMSEQLYSVAP